MLQNMNNTTVCCICIWIIPEYLKVYSISSGEVECKPSWVSLSLSFEGRKIPLAYIKGGVRREDSMNSTPFSPPLVFRSPVYFLSSGGGEDWQRRRGACGPSSKELCRAELPVTASSSSCPVREICPLYSNMSPSLKEKPNVQVPGKREMPYLL